MSNEGQLRWGILGTGQIARTFVEGVNHSQTGCVVAVGSRSQAKADAFGDALKIPNRHGSYDALLADPAVEAVYVATPHPEHVEWAVKAAEARKHVLCEKPLAVNAADAQRIVDAAERNGVFLMEAFMYRCHPQTAKVVELVRRKEIGEVRAIQATFSFALPFDANHRIWNNDLAGGGILDVGCYPVSFARLIAGAATGRDFADPIAVVGAAQLHPVTGIDAYAAGVLTFEGGIIAQVACGVGVEQQNVARIYGTAGSITVLEPWNPSTRGRPSRVDVNFNGQPTPEEYAFDDGGWLYAYEADTVARNLERKQARSPAMSWADTLGNMRTLDRWRQAVGLTYEQEKRVERERPV